MQISPQIGRDGAGGPMALHLEAEDRDLLDRVLTFYVSELRMEIAGTDAPGFRRGLKAEEERIKAIVGRLRRP